MSMFMSLMILNALEYTNTMILFGLIMICTLVDTGIVVVENVYRLGNGRMTRIEAAKGIGEIAFHNCIYLTTVAAFILLGCGQVLWVSL